MYMHDKHGITVSTDSRTLLHRKDSNGVYKTLHSESKSTVQDLYWSFPRQIDALLMLHPTNELLWSETKHLSFIVQPLYITFFLNDVSAVVK